MDLVLPNVVLPGGLGDRLIWLLSETYAFDLKLLAAFPVGLSFHWTLPEESFTSFPSVRQTGVAPPRSILFLWTYQANGFIWIMSLGATGMS